MTKEEIKMHIMFALEHEINLYKSVHTDVDVTLLIDGIQKYLSSRDNLYENSLDYIITEYGFKQYNGALYSSTSYVKTDKEIYELSGVEFHDALAERLIHVFYKVRSLVTSTPEIRNVHKLIYEYNKSLENDAVENEYIL